MYTIVNIHIINTNERNEYDLISTHKHVLDDGITHCIQEFC